MARGGKRQGTPGKAYSNRTDLSTGYAPQEGMTTAAAGGQTAPAPAAPAAPADAAGPNLIHPDSVKGMFDPTDRPNTPVTTGLPTGPGAGPDRGNLTEDLQTLAKHIPMLQFLAQRPDTPATVINFLSYLQAKVTP